MHTINREYSVYFCYGKGKDRRESGVFTEEQLKFLNLYAHHYNNGADYVIV